jgi:hypothetical protein
MQRHRVIGALVGVAVLGAAAYVLKENPQILKHPGILKNPTTIKVPDPVRDVKSYMANSDQAAAEAAIGEAILHGKREITWHDKRAKIECTAPDKANAFYVVVDPQNPDATTKTGDAVLTRPRVVNHCAEQLKAAFATSELTPG